MSVIGKKPYINTIIDELLEDEVGVGAEVLTDLGYLVNETDKTEETPLDFTNPLEEIYNYDFLGQVCSVTYAALKLSEGTIKNGFLIVTPHHTAFFAFGKNEENMECYDLVWTEYERSYTPVNESLDANEFRREIALQGGSGGGGAKPLIIEVEGTANTSTLPAIVVPAMTPAQVFEAYRAIQEGKTVIVSTEDGAKFFVDEANANSATSVSIRFVYYNAYLEYTYNRRITAPFTESVTYEYTGLGGGGGTKLYMHNLWFDLYGRKIIQFISTTPTPISMSFETWWNSNSEKIICFTNFFLQGTTNGWTGVIGTYKDNTYYVNYETSGTPTMQKIPTLGKPSTDTVTEL